MIGGIEMNSEINAFINKYVKEIRNNNAAFFNVSENADTSQQ